MVQFQHIPAVHAGGVLTTNTVIIWVVWESREKLPIYALRLEDLLVVLVIFAVRRRMVEHSGLPVACIIKMLHK